MGILINLSILIIMCLAMYINNITATKAKGNILLGSTLPAKEINNNEVIEIVKQYKKGNVKLILLMIITFIPCFLKDISFLFSFIYMLLWIFLVMFFETKFFRKYFGMIQELKRKNDWFIKNKYIMNIDTEVSKLRKKKAISMLWFLFPVAIVVETFTLKQNYILIIFSILVILLCLLFHYYYSNKRKVVYSQDEKVNLGYNYIEKRVWSIIWVVSSSIFSITSLIFALNEKIGVLFILICIVSSLCVLLFGYGIIRKKRKELLSISNSTICYDDDKFWETLFYNNPNDTNIMVEKRVGIGTTINIGNPKSKVFIGIFIGIMLLVNIPLFIIIGKLSVSEPKLSVEENKVVIDVIMYRTEFNLNEIQEVNKIKKMPKGNKTNGFATEEKEIGHFNYNGYGTSLSYVNKEVDEIILIKLKDKYIFINGKDRDKTDEYYEELKEGIN